MKTRHFAIESLERVERLARLSASVKNARSSRQPCSMAVSDHAGRIAAYAGDRAVFFRLAGKAEPANLGQGRDFVPPARLHSVEHGQMMKLQRLLASTSPAKAPNVDSVEAVAARIAKVGSIL